MNFTRISGDGNATAYTVGYELLEPSEDPELEPAGYHSPQMFYVVMTPADVAAGYDVHAIARELPGDASWVIDELQSLSVETTA